MEQNHDIVEVSGGKLKLQGLNCLSFALEPLPGNKGTYPLIAVINGETNRPLLMEGRHLYGQGKVITEAIVDVSFGLGQDGDKWRVVKNNADDWRASRYNVNGQGDLVVAQRGAEVLFRLDSRYQWDSWFSDWSGVGSYDPQPVALSIQPINNVLAALGDGGGISWDVSRFRRVLFSVELRTDQSTLLEGSWKPFVRTQASAGPGGHYLAQMFCGSDGDLGDASAVPAKDKPALTIELGAPGPDVVTAFTMRTGSLPPFLQFGLLFEGPNLDTSPLIEFDSDTYMVITAVGY